MNAGATTGRPTLAGAPGWGLLLAVVVVATWIVGPVALMVLAFVCGGALIVTGVRAKGWPRPVLIIVGALVVSLPVLPYLDLATGFGTFTAR